MVTKTHWLRWTGLTLAAALLLAPSQARADFPSQALYIGMYGGGNLVLRDWDFPSGRSKEQAPSHSGLGGGRLGFHILSQLAVEAEVAYMRFDITGGNDVLSYDLDVLFHFMKGNWSPTVSVGFGNYHNVSASKGLSTGLNPENDYDPRLHIGLGLRGMVVPGVAFRVDVRDVISDGFTSTGSNNIEILAGLDFFVWPSPRSLADKDKDKIIDDEDKCPTEPGPAALGGCPDGDNDGIADKDDACPLLAGKAALKGCPDKDDDGVPDQDDACPDVAKGSIPDAEKTGCPADSDADGVADEKDACRDVHAGKIPDAAKPGCPSDKDNDGIIDEKDACVDVAQGKIPDLAKVGCPADKDADGIIDEKDACVDVKGVANDDPAKNGCPPDKDGDTVPDEKDACPDKVGAPDPDPKKNGCPGLVEVKQGEIKILEQVFFATNKDQILPKSFPLLNAVAFAVKQLPSDRRVSVEGHTDNKGDPKKNQDLSQRRANSVMKYLVEKGGIQAGVLEAHGFGQDKPIAPNDNEAGRAKNRRVEFRVVNVNATPAK